jgi:hypothetical protein
LLIGVHIDESEAARNARPLIAIKMCQPEKEPNARHQLIKSVPLCAESNLESLPYWSLK